MKRDHSSGNSIGSMPQRSLQVLPCLRNLKHPWLCYITPTRQGVVGTSCGYEGLPHVFSRKRWTVMITQSFLNLHTGNSSLAVTNRNICHLKKTRQASRNPNSQFYSRHRLLAHLNTPQPLEGVSYQTQADNEHAINGQQDKLKMQPHASGSNTAGYLSNQHLYQKSSLLTHIQQSTNVH